MTILLLGGSGQVGGELARALASLDTVAALARTEADQAAPETLRDVVRRLRPALIVNAAAYTAVDQAKREPELAHRINGIAPGVLAEEALRLRIPLVHYSTDYVFDGAKPAPYVESDETSPLNIYGRTKLAGELAIVATGAQHLIFRTSWVYGARGKNFLLTVLKLARERERLTIVNDQIGAPTWSRTIAEVTATVLSRMKVPDGGYNLGAASGVYHLTAAGETSWFGFAKTVIEGDPRREEHKVRWVDPVSTVEYGAPELRPANSRLNTTRLRTTFGVALPEWQAALHQVLGELSVSE